MAIFDYLKGLIHHTLSPEINPHDGSVRTPTPLEEISEGPVWCVAANVVMERPFGPGGKEIRRGTKHFAPGAKVFVCGFFWGMGGENVTVSGRHRKTHQFITVTMRAKHLANWRAELVYSPYVIQQVREYGEFGKAPESEKARLHAEHIAASYIKRGAATQPFVTRPSE